MTQLIQPIPAIKSAPASKIWLSSPHMHSGELKYIQDAFNANWIAPIGPQLEGFEADIKRFTGAGDVAALASGTSAIHLALSLLGVGPGDEVICQSLTFIASANPICYLGASPVFVDSEEETWNMCPKLLRTAIIDRMMKGKKPKAIIPVHLYGMPAKMEELLQVSAEFDIPIVEDAAEALGSTYRDQAMGTFGALGIYSFNGNKIITTSGGGALLARNPEHTQRAKFLATQARDPKPYYQHTTIGYNYRMSNVSAAIGRGQMEVIQQRVRQRRGNYEFYRTALEIYPGIRFLKEPQGAFSNRWLTVIEIDPQEAGLNREILRLALENANIESRPVWKPMHMQPVFNGVPAYLNGVSERLFKNGLCLPSGSNLTLYEMHRILECIEKTLSRKFEMV